MVTFEAVIGLEVHAQLNTKTKIFCGCSTGFGAPPNENTCPVCLGLPGALPVLNKKVVELALRAALAVGCHIPPVSVFARKNYFYPDLPKGYQISQYDQPLAVEGSLQFRIHDSTREIRIRRIHMEEDAGKLLHEGVEEPSEASFVDLNRAGVPLIEIVSEPDIRNSEEAYLYLKELKAILQFCEVSEANMEEGNLRCDANISIRRNGASELGTRVEIKNLNSFKNVSRALDHEFDRQQKIVQSGGEIIQETRLYDADHDKTHSMRSKEEAQDYRYFPDPDLLPLKIDSEILDRIRQSLPELPEAKRQRFQTEYALSKMEASVLTEDEALAQYFEQTARLSGEPKQTANWIMRDLLEKMKESSGSIHQSPVTPAHLAALIRLTRENKISNTQAKEVFQEMWSTAKMPDIIVSEKGLSQVSDLESVNRFVDQVFTENSDLVARFKNGETKLQGVLVGLVIKKSGGKANPAIVNKLIKERAG
jgi:aspartyl-tRNA(Asn)/glutamyl-tRNA(Gln) amidotransferase subunit B